MRFVGVRTLENQAALMHHKAREMRVAQRTRAQRSNHRRDGSRRRKGAPPDDHSRLGPGDGLGDSREH